jgi:hypothetical protein
MSGKLRVVQKLAHLSVRKTTLDYSSCIRVALPAFELCRMSILVLLALLHDGQSFWGWCGIFRLFIIKESQKNPPEIRKGCDLLA